jgi:K+-transporting ATPase ATPase A chain
MTSVAGWSQIALLAIAVTALGPPLGGYMARVYQGERVVLSPVAAPLERLAYRLCRVDPAVEHGWREYARAVLMFSLAGWLALYLVLRSQSVHPFNPEGFAAGPWDLSFNTASSFVTNTSWQFYGGETTLSFFSQMAGIVVASFASGAVGMAVAVALIRALARRGAATLGNFWVDLTRSSSASRSAPWPARRRSSCSRATAAASSTSTPRCRSRTRRR